jgi:hypothetical protein
MEVWFEGHDPMLSCYPSLNTGVSKRLRLRALGPDPSRNQYISADEFFKSVRLQEVGHCFLTGFDLLFVSLIGIFYFLQTRYFQFTLFTQVNTLLSSS